MHVVQCRIVNEYSVTIKSSTQSVGGDRACETSTNNKYKDTNRSNYFKIAITKFGYIFGCNPLNLMFLGAN